MSRPRCEREPPAESTFANGSNHDTAAVLRSKNTPSAAVLFALRLQQGHHEEPDLPGVRTGIHMGEVSERPGPDDDAAHPRVDGLAVDLAVRYDELP
jgi:hypothetical protein